MFNKIALITNKNGSNIAETVKTVCDLLLARNIEVVVDEQCFEILNRPDLAKFGKSQLPADCDMAIAIGGDGTMLTAAASLANFDIPLLGINRGRLGFLTDIPADSVEVHLNGILDGDYEEDERFQLHCQVDRGDDTIIETDAFNDVVIQKWNIARLIELTTYVDSKLVNSQRSDGMIIATPHRLNGLCHVRGWAHCPPCTRCTNFSTNLSPHPELSSDCY